MVLLGVGVWLWPTGGDEGLGEPTYTVVRGPLIISVVEGGEIEAEDKANISNKTNRSVIIKAILDEGTAVRKGDMVVEFECQDLLDLIEGSKLTLLTSENKHTEASETLKLVRKKVANDLSKAKQDVIDAKENQIRYVKGEGPLKGKKLKSSISLAKRDLLLAQEKLSFKLRANADKRLDSPYSENEIKADRLGVDRMVVGVEEAESDLRMFHEYDDARSKRNLATAITDAELGLEKATITARTETMIAETAEMTLRQNLMQNKKIHAGLLEEQQDLMVKAEADGLVVYASGSRWWQEAPASDVGDTVKSRQRLMIIPDMTSLQVKTKVYESVISMVKPGLPATVSVDAQGNRILLGTISNVDAVPASQHRFLSPGVKVFNVIVDFEEGTDTTGLKPGMTVEVELELERLDDVISIPVAAVFTEQEQTYCRKIVDGHYVKTPIKVGRMNETHVEIRDGLSVGDEILLSVPLTDTAAPNGNNARSRPDRRADTKGAAKPAMKTPATKPVGMGGGKQGKRPAGKGQPK